LLQLHGKTYFDKKYLFTNNLMIHSMLGYEWIAGKQAVIRSSCYRGNSYLFPRLSSNTSGTSKNRGISHLNLQVNVLI